MRDDEITIEQLWQFIENEYNTAVKKHEDSVTRFEQIRMWYSDDKDIVKRVDLSYVLQRLVG